MKIRFHAAPYIIKVEDDDRQIVCAILANVCSMWLDNTNQVIIGKSDSDNLLFVILGEEPAVKQDVDTMKIFVAAFNEAYGESLRVWTPTRHHSFVSELPESVATDENEMQMEISKLVVEAFGQSIDSPTEELWT